MDISFQLYSARNFTPWADVIKMIAEQGYTQVEGFGGVYDDPGAFKALLDSHGLSMPSGHFFPISEFEGGFEASIKAAHALGMERLYCPAPEDAWREGTDAANWIALAKRMEEACKKVNDAGLRFGWHNHHWEFLPLPGGEIAMDLILEHAPSIEWEMDVAWVIQGGGDPMSYIREHGSRISAAHVKDIAAKGTCEDEDGWADVGHGTVDWASLMQALRAAGTDLFVMEHDNPSDAQRFASRSIATFREL